MSPDSIANRRWTWVWVTSSPANPIIRVTRNITRPSLESAT